MQEMGRLKTDITDKVDRVGTELNSLVEKVTFMKNEIKQKMYRMETDIIEKVSYMFWYEITEEEGRLSKALQPQIHKMVKEYQQLHKT